MMEKPLFSAEKNHPVKNSFCHLDLSCGHVNFTTNFLLLQYVVHLFTCFLKFLITTMAALLLTLLNLLFGLSSQIDCYCE